MAVTLTGNGGIFQKIGHLAGGLADVMALQGASATARVLSGSSFATRGTTLETDASYSPAVSRELDGHWTAIDAWRGSQASIFNSFKQIAEKILIRQVDLDASLPSKDLTSALTELIRQMKANSDSINGASISAGSQTTVLATGTPKLVVSVKNAQGYNLQYGNNETLRFVVTTDAYTGGATARRETITVKGASAVADPASYLWPAGSACSKTITVGDAQADNVSGNCLLYNGSFEDFSTSGYADDWVIATGTAASDVTSAGSSDAYTGSNALKLIGDGSTQLTLRQSFDTAHSTSAGAGGTPAELEPLTQYAVGFWAKRGGSAVSAGVLTVSLVNGSNTVTTDHAGTNNSFTADLTSLTGTYAFFSGTFRTPAVIPTSGLKLQLKTTTAIDNTKIVYIDDLCLQKMTQLYAGGPYVAAMAGSVNCVLNDSWTVAISSTMGTLGHWLERIFALRAKGLQFPHDDGGSETVADSVVA